jgi:hypothetical protein
VFSPRRTLAVEIDSRSWPQFAAWAHDARRHMQGWWPTILQTLVGPSERVPRGVTVRFAAFTPQMLAAWTGEQYPRALAHPEWVGAVTVGSTIIVNASYLQARLGDPDLIGMMAHELTHAAQAYPSGVCVWLKEGLADYLRYYVLLPHDPGGGFDPKVQSYADGFAPAAGLLDWIERTWAGTTMRLNAVMRRGGDGPAAIRAITREELDTLWANYLLQTPDAGQRP